jgi:hypothetical protein
MEHGDLAQTAAVLGAAGSALVLLARTRLPLFAGFALLAAAEAALVVALVPRSDLEQLRSPTRVAALVLAGLAVLALAAGLVRFPAVVPVALLVAAPFRLPVELGSQEAFLLLPLYGVLAAASLALLWRSARGPVKAVPPLLAVPAAAFIVVDALSLLWSRDLEQGSIELVFFIFPFAALLTVVARSPFESWLPRALAVTIVSLAAVFAAIGLWQAGTHTLFFAQDLRVANAYTTFFRVTSVFKDPSIYGRELVVAIVVLLVALWLSKLNLILGAGIVALLFAGLYFSYSQSSMVVLFVAALAVSIVLGDGRSRRIVTVGALAIALAGAAVFAVSVQDASLRSATSGRSRLLSVTTRVLDHNPLHGVGVGAQPKASQEETRSGSVKRSASHTTPLTVLAELGAIGFVLYMAFLAAAARLLYLAARRHGPVALGFAAAFFCLVLHSFFYSGFFEDPLTWGVLGVAAASLSAPALARSTSTETAGSAASDRPRGRLGRLTRSGVEARWHT